MEQDIRILNDQIEVVRNELDTGMPRIREEGGPEAAAPLKNRLTSFLQVAEPRLLALGKQKDSVAEKLKVSLKLLVQNLLFIGNAYLI